jgi:hypothetical protein
MGKPVPTNVIVEMNRRGFSDFDIIRYLRGKGYTPVEINDAMNHAKVKMELTRSAADEQEEKPSIREIEVEEEPKKFITEVQLKELLIALNSKLKVIEERNKFQENAIQEIKEQLPKIIQQQVSSIKTLNADVQALQQTFSKILEPLAHNVKVMSGVLDLGKEEKSTQKIEKEIKKVEVQEGIVAKNVIKRQPGYLYFVDKEGNVKKTKAKGKKPRTKVIKKTVTVTETKQPEKTKKSKKKGEPSLDDIF